MKQLPWESLLQTHNYQYGRLPLSTYWASAFPGCATMPEAFREVASSHHLLADEIPLWMSWSIRLCNGNQRASCLACPHGICKVTTSSPTASKSDVDVPYRCSKFSLVKVERTPHLVLFSTVFEYYSRYGYSLFLCSMDRTNRVPSARNFRVPMPHSSERQKRSVRYCRRRAWSIPFWARTYVYKADVTKEQTGVDSEDMILITLMSGRDYIPLGIPICGLKTACEAAKAGYGHDLCQLSKDDTDGIQQWRHRLVRELRTKESKFFQQKHRAIEVSETFPDTAVWSYYTTRLPPKPLPRSVAKPSTPKLPMLKVATPAPKWPPSAESFKKAIPKRKRRPNKPQRNARQAC